MSWDGYATKNTNLARNLVDWLPRVLLTSLVRLELCTLEPGVETVELIGSAVDEDVTVGGRDLYSGYRNDLAVGACRSG